MIHEQNMLSAKKHSAVRPCKTKARRDQLLVMHIHAHWTPAQQHVNPIFHATVFIAVVDLYAQQSIPCVARSN